MSWQTCGSQPTDNQIDYIKELCDYLNMDYEAIKPSTFIEALDLISELVDEAKDRGGWRSEWLNKW